MTKNAANTLDTFTDTMKAAAKWGDNPFKLVDGITAETGSKAMKALETGGDFAKESKKAVWEMKAVSGADGIRLKTSVDESVSFFKQGFAGTDGVAKGARKSGSGSYYFRGTTEGYAGNSALQRLEITPTSTDPLVSTVFAINGEQYGKGVLYICSADDLKGVSTTAKNVLNSYEKEVCFNIQPLEFANRASISISASDARAILKDMGYDIPSRIINRDISPFLRNAPSLSDVEILKFVEKAGGM